MKNYIKKELVDLKTLVVSLLKGKGSLSDYLLVTLDVLIGVVIGAAIF